MLVALEQLAALRLQLRVVMRRLRVLASAKVCQEPLAPEMLSEPLATGVLVAAAVVEMA